MTTSVGLSHTTGEVITDWTHVEQSISFILATRIGTLVLRRDFGSELPDLVDAPMTPRVMLMFYIAAATALRRWEPRFELVRCQMIEANETGQIGLDLDGIYYPRGHLGDKSLAESRQTRVFLNENRIAA